MRHKNNQNYSMKKLYILAALFWTILINAQGEFITTWEITPFSGLTIEFPIVEDPTNNYTISFGDGTTLTNQTGPTTHTYNAIGTYTIIVSGIFKRIKFYESAYYSNFRIKTIQQWGTNQWTSMENAFRGCQNLSVLATDTPDLTQVTSTRFMFTGCFSGVNTIVNQINNWDVSNVTDMSYMFASAYGFNQPIDSWDVSNVSNMQGMFLSTTHFNQPINSWDVSSVTNMSDMFGSNWDFNQPINNWDVSNVIHMNGMFQNAISFNQPLSDWNTGNVINMYMMFMRASSFNQPLNNWNVSNVVSTHNMFNEATAFNQPLNNWDVTNLLYTGQMFRDASSFNQDLSDWNVINATEFINFLDRSGLDINNYDALLDKFAALGLTNRVLGVEGLKYCNVTDRNILINDLGWVITGDELNEDCSLGINKDSLKEKILFYPNPAKDFVNFKAENGVAIKSIEIYNMLGQKVMTISFIQSTTAVDVSGLSVGTYLTKVVTDDGNTIVKFIKE